jgi:trk system potassium uptake protein TrkH
MHDGAESAFDEAFLLTVATGAGLWYATRKETRDLTIRDGFLMVALVWTVLPVYAALPLVLQLNAQFYRCLFRSRFRADDHRGDGFVGLDELPVSINFWRTQLVWLGGMGLIVLAVAILPLLGIGGRQMFKAETPGPMKDSKMTPRMAETAKGLWVVYTLISICCAWLLLGRNDLARCDHAHVRHHGLGGFSSHDASFAFFDSPAIEAVSIVFMLIAGCNFATHYVVLSGRSLRPYASDPEAGWFLLVTLGSVIGIAIFLDVHEVYPTFLEALRYSAFNVVSIATTTGYANTDYALWPFFAPLWMLFLCSFATSAGSTGGGIKMIRAIVLYKQVYRELTRAMHPSAVHPVKIGGAVVPSNILFAVLAFGFIYMVCIVSMTLLFHFRGSKSSPHSRQWLPASTTPDRVWARSDRRTIFGVLTDFQTWVCTFAMLLGRLEIFTLLVVLTPAFWRK